MQKITSPYRYDFVGSFLRPENLKQARKDYRAGKISKEQLTAVEDAAIRELVAKQKQAGYLALIRLARRALEECIDLLGFSAPDRM